MSVSLPQAKEKKKHGTGIGWTHVPGYKGETLNPVRARNLQTGALGHWCQKVSPGCAQCYAETLNLSDRFQWATHAPYTPAGRKQVEIILHEETLRKPLQWRDPRCIFWEDMSDLFGEWVPDEWLDKSLAVCAYTHRHLHLWLTKRPDRMAEYFSKVGREGDSVWCDRWDAARRWLRSQIAGNTLRSQQQREYVGVMMANLNWPLPNLWLGTSAEDQPRLKERLPHLCRCPAVRRFLSLEPLIGPINFCDGPVGESVPDLAYEAFGMAWSESNCAYERLSPEKIHWVIIGGESDSDRRECEVKWIEDLVKQCELGGAACFVKQDSALYPGQRGRLSDKVWARKEFPLRSALK